MPSKWHFNLLIFLCLEIFLMTANSGRQMRDKYLMGVTHCQAPIFSFNHHHHNMQETICVREARGHQRGAYTDQ